MAFRYISMDNAELRGGDLGLEREGGNREVGGKVSEMDVESEMEDAGIHGKERIAKGTVKDKRGEENMGKRKEVGAVEMESDSVEVFGRNGEEGRERAGWIPNRRGKEENFLSTGAGV